MRERLIGGMAAFSLFVGLAGWGASMSGDVHVMPGRALLSIGSAGSILSVLWVVWPLLRRRSTPPAAAQVASPRFMVEPHTAMSADGRLTVINHGDGASFSARAEVLAAEPQAAKKGDYRLGWVEATGWEAPIHRRGTAHLLLATTDDSLRNKHDLVDLILWQQEATARTKWDFVRWFVKEQPARVVIRVTVYQEAATAGKVAVYMIEAGRFGGCLVRLATEAERVAVDSGSPLPSTSSPR